MAIETEKNAASGSTVVDENRGRDDVRQNPKKRGTSKDVVASLDQRVAGVETSMAELKNQVEGLEGLDSDFASMREDFREALIYILWRLEELNSIDKRFVRWACSRRIQRGVWRKSSGSNQQSITLIWSEDKMFPNHPRSWEKREEARAVMISCWDMEQYLRVVNMVDVLPRSKDGDPSIFLRNAKERGRRVGFVNLSKSGKIREYYGLRTELERRGSSRSLRLIAQAGALIDFSTKDGLFQA
ncbi:hypothetical protein Tco_0603321 [Tanacetum coccineum]